MSNFTEINPLQLPSVALLEKHKLPQLPAIYFAIAENGEILYIGRSVNLASRWNGHHRYLELKEIGNVRIAWLSCDDESLLPQIEEAMIKHFLPCLNHTLVKYKQSKSKLGKPYVDKLIKIARKARGSMSQRVFAKFLGVSFSTVQAWERGDSIPDIQNLAKIAERAEYSIEELFGDLGMKPASKPSDLAVILRQINKMPLTDVAQIVQAGAARISAAAESISNEAKAS